MKKYVCAGIFCLSQLFAAGHSSPAMLLSELTISAGTENTWKTAYIDAEILIESSVIVFEDNNGGIRHERVVFRYTNLTAQKVALSFGRTLYYDGVCYGCDKQDKKYTVELEPKETKEFSAINKDKSFYIFSKDLKNTIRKKLDNYHIVNIEKQVK